MNSVVNTNLLRFPSGLSIRQAKSNAKKLVKELGITLHAAQDMVAKQEGINMPWAQAVHHISCQKAQPSFKSDMNPLRKLAVIGLNEIINRGLLSLYWDGKSKIIDGYIETMIAGKNSIVLYQDAGFGEVTIAVWWNYVHSKHPQADSKGNFKECFSAPSPLAKKHLYRYFVGAVAAFWLERENGPYLQGEGYKHMPARYTRHDAKEVLKMLPNPKANGFSVEGKFHI